MRNILIIIVFFFAGNKDIYSRIIIKNFDINKDGIKDKIEIDTISNTYVFNYLKNKNKFSKKIIFFKGFNSDAVTIDFNERNNILTFKLSYAPNYNDFDIVRFSYFKNKDDWYLLDIRTHRFNPLDKNLLSTECFIKKCLTRKISLLKNNFKMIQDITESKKYKRNCRQFSEE